MATLESKLRLSLIDDVSRKAKTIFGSLDHLQKGVSAPWSGLTAKVVAFGGAYLGLSAAYEKGFKPAADQQSALTEIGIKADLSQTQLAQLQRRLVDLSPKVNQFTDDLTKGIDTMLTMGLSAKDAQGAIPAVGKAATATGAAIEDLSSSAVSAIQNLDVLPAQIGKMFDGMAEAGNAGAFELKDMAQYFPQLTASAKTLGMQGVPAINDMAAALQVARRGAGDASTAAKNMSDVRGTIMTPQTVKNFKKFGVDVTKELQKAHAKGISPIEHFIKLIDQKTKGGRGDLLTQIFGDKQTLDFIRPMIAGFNDYLRIRGEADRADGTVAAAYDRRMQDANQKIKAFQIQMTNLGTSLGSTFLKPVGEGAQYLADVLDTLDQRVTIFDRLKAGATGFLSGLGLQGDDLKGLVTDLQTFLVGSPDASKAADEYGRIFGRFREWGQHIRSFYDAVKDNPIVKFLGELSGYGFQFFVVSAGIGMLAGTIMKLARALAVLSGITTAIGVLKAFAKIGGVAGEFASIPGLEGKGSGAGSTSKAPTVLPWLSRAGTWLKGFGGQAMLGAVPQILSDTPGDTFKEQVANQEQFRKDLIGWGTWIGSLFKSAPASNVGLSSAGNISSAERNRQLGFVGSTDMLPGKAADDVVRIDASSISAMTQPSGVQDVKVTNMERPNVTVHAPITITGVSDPKAAANAAVDQLGSKMKSTLDGSFGGGAW